MATCFSRYSSLVIGVPAAVTAVVLGAAAAAPRFE
jgi:hypothetical protein